MFVKTSLLALFFLQFVSMQKNKPTVRTAASIGGLQLGTYIDLTTATIEYDTQVLVGTSNKVRVRTNPAVTNAALYVNVSDACEINEYTYCAKTSSPANFLGDPITISLSHVGSGVYEGYYTIMSDNVGALVLVLFYARDCLTGKVYANERFEGSSAKDVCDSTIDFDWVRDPVHGVAADYASVKWFGQWIFPETGQYKFRGGVDDKVDLYLDQVHLGTFEFGDFEYDIVFSKYMTAGAHDFRVDYVEEDRDANVKLLWDYPSPRTVVPSGYFRSFISKIAGTFTATCLPGSYLNKGMKRCVQCPRGTCQPAYGRFLCTPCKQSS